MQVKAIYDHGWLQLPPGLHLKRPRLSLTVTIPDHEIAPGVTRALGERPAGEALERERWGGKSSQRVSIRAAIDEILGPWRERLQNGPPVSSQEYDSLRYKALEGKYLDRR